MAQETHSAFFSYSREDSEFVLKLAKDLKAAGAAVWLDQLDIRPGQHWDSALEDALANSPNMLLVLSPPSVASTNVMDEVSFALEEQKLIIPVLYRTCKIPLRLRRVQYIDARTEYGKALEELAQLLAPDETAKAERETRKKEQQERHAAEKDKTERDVEAQAAAEKRVEQQGLATERAAVESASREKAVPQQTAAGEPRDERQLRAKRWITAAAIAAALVLGGVIWHAVATRPSEAASSPSAEPVQIPNTEWVNGFLQALEGPSVDGLRAFFDETVSPYYSMPHADWAAIEKDKENYFHRYPTVQYTLVGEPKELTQSEDKAAMEVDMLYVVIRNDGQRLQGTSHLSMNLQLVNGQWKIAGITEKVSK